MQEMYQVFNMGTRLELYVAPEAANEIIEIARSFEIDAAIIGRVEAADTRSLQIHTAQGILKY